ncbi:hypothetical protein [Mycobacterium asiaticum]|uniref:hypothetical protein n=1 Tax=Mycobacterium asiaticum TaxID=1790 RepID=UPI000B0F1F73|nr:hypothetical protein [Mycobacterium asiaticum]
MAGEEIRRRQRFGHPVPSTLRDLLDALNCELSAEGNPAPPDAPAWKTTKELAAEWGCTPRTVRNKAAAAGGKLVAGRYIFPEDT